MIKMNRNKIIKIKIKVILYENINWSLGISTNLIIRGYKIFDLKNTQVKHESKEYRNLKRSTWKTIFKKL